MFNKDIFEYYDNFVEQLNVLNEQYLVNINLRLDGVLVVNYLTEKIGYENSINVESFELDLSHFDNYDVKTKYLRILDSVYYLSSNSTTEIKKSKLFKKNMDYKKYLCDSNIFFIGGLVLSKNPDNESSYIVYYNNHKIHINSNNKNILKELYLGSKINGFVPVYVNNFPKMFQFCQLSKTGNIIFEENLVVI
jgi:hypothetical protein